MVVYVNESIEGFRVSYGTYVFSVREGRRCIAGVRGPKEDFTSLYATIASVPTSFSTSRLGAMTLIDALKRIPDELLGLTRDGEYVRVNVVLLTLLVTCLCNKRQPDSPLDLFPIISEWFKNADTYLETCLRDARYSEKGALLIQTGEPIDGLFDRLYLVRPSCLSSRPGEDMASRFTFYEPLTYMDNFTTYLCWNNSAITSIDGRYKYWRISAGLSYVHIYLARKAQRNNGQPPNVIPFSWDPEVIKTRKGFLVTDEKVIKRFVAKYTQLRTLNAPSSLWQLSVQNQELHAILTASLYAQCARV
jgi:hypothetical protein